MNTLRAWRLYEFSYSLAYLAITAGLVDVSWVVLWAPLEWLCQVSEPYRNRLGEDFYLLQALGELLAAVTSPAA